MMKKIVNDEQLWATSNVKETCADLYESISGGDNSMDIEELERWAMKNWMEMKRDFADGRFDNIASKRASPVSPSSSRASPTTTSVATSPIKFGQGAPQSLSPPIPRTFDAVYPSIGGTAGSKSTGSLLVNATDTPPPLRIEDKHRALEEARRLRAAAQKAAEDAMRAQARAKRPNYCGCVCGGGSICCREHRSAVSRICWEVAQVAGHPCEDDARPPPT